MPGTCRSASILLFCLGLVAVMVTVGFSLLQSIRLSSGSSTASQRQWLAQEAAGAGIQHAMENIVADYASKDADSTCLDGGWHRPFYRLTAADVNQPSSATRAGAEDDARGENQVWNGIGGSFLSTGGYGQNFYPFSMGVVYGMNGVARWYEVGYYEPADRTATRFTDAAAPVPSRHQGLFLDENLRRIVPGVAESDADVRRRARYRLRYAAVVNDLGGSLLINPALDADYRDAWMPGTPALPNPASADPAAFLAPTALGQRLERYRNSIFNMVNAGYVKDNAPVLAYRVEHAFMLRGQYMNTARDATGWPVAFPTMYRHSMQWSNPAFGWQSHRAAFSSANPSGQGVSLYRNKAGEARLEGGQSIIANYCTWVTGSPSYTLWDNRGESGLFHNLVGPQFSFSSMRPLITGYQSDLGGSGDATHTLFSLTPFGRPMRAAASTRPWEWHHGPTDVPWLVNALTANPNTLSGMVLGYLPPAAKTMKLAVENYHCFAGLNADGEDTFSPSVHTIVLPAAKQVEVTAAYGRDLFIDAMSPAFRLWPAPSGQPRIDEVDLKSTTGSGDDTHGFPLLSAAQTPALWPNYWIPEPRPPGKVYPGKYASLCSALSAADNELADDTGRFIDADSALGNRWGVDSHSACQLLNPGSLGPERRSRGGSGSGTNGHLPGNWTGWALSRTDDKDAGNGIETPMPTGSETAAKLWGGTPGTWGYHAKDYIETTSDGSFKFQDSYWFDMARAFATAMSVLRAHWVAEATTWVDPAASFPAGKEALSDMDSVADLDALFLQQLGIDIAAPSSATVKPSWRILNIGPPYQFKRNGVTLKNNIRSLVTGDLLASGTVTSIQRARAMELMLNDWRMSFLGASPDYPAFRPLDVDGDGHAVASCYAATWTTPEGDVWPASAASGGIGDPPDTYFSLTGCFSFAKSRFYRIITRGELWDNLLAKPVAMMTADAAVVVDPDGDVDRSATPRTGLNHDIGILYQRWYWNRYSGQIPTTGQ